MLADPTRPSSPTPALGPGSPTDNGAVSTPSGQPTRAGTPPRLSEVKDTTREVVETVVFVVVLVLLLKTFVAEAFVIPTGSMAETLYGYQKNVTCPQCGHDFPVNCSTESEPQPGRMPQRIYGCTCPNCQYSIDWRARVDGQIAHDPNGNWIIEGPRPATGDRVLVSKYLYDGAALTHPNRHDVVVFKYPVDPHASQAMNYIKRCVGLPQETLAIFNGDLYVTRSLDYPENKFPRTAFRDRERADGWIGRALRGDPHDPVMFAPARPLDLWQPQNMFSNADQALKLFEQSRTRAALGAAEPGDFEIVRKSPARMMSMRRLVNDNDHQAADLVAMGMPPRWYAETDRTWTADNSREPRVFARVADETPMAWLRYRHLQPERPGVDGQLAQRDFQPHVITNTMGYNSNKPGHEQADDWVGDLMLEATALVSSSSGQLALELSKGHERFQARFDLATGECRLLRIDEKGEEKELAKAATSMTRRGSYALRLANFDERLTLWVNGQLPFGDGFAYAPAERPLDVADRPTDNDLLRPAGIGVEGADVRISHLKLWRDTCYTRPSQARPAVHGDSRVWTYFVQPGHFLCLGDNSAESSDSRFWGLVPERLMLGRAVTIYWPPTRMRVIQ